MRASVHGSCTTAPGEIQVSNMREIPLTVAIPFFNSEKTLHYAIESVLSQEFQDYELLLVNDGSSDESVDIARRYCTEPRVRLIDDRKNYGLAPRLNQIAAEARGTFLARMDSDDIMHPHRLARQMDFLTKRKEIDLLGTSIYFIDGSYRITGKKHTALVRLCRKFSYYSLFHPTVMGRTKCAGSAEI